MKLSRCLNIEDLHTRARSSLPAPIYHYLAGGADDEWSLRRNNDAFRQYELLPRYLRNIGEIDLSTRLVGLELRLPFILSPTGMSRLFHREKEPSVARAAADFGTLYSLSTMSTTTIEDIAALNDVPKMFQIYIFKIY